MSRTTTSAVLLIAWSLTSSGLAWSDEPAASPPTAPQPPAGTPAAPAEAPPPPPTSPPPPPSAAGAPNPGAAPAAPPPIPPPPAAAANRSVYDEQFVGFGDFTVMTWRGPRYIEGAYQGAYHRSLSMPEYFSIVGHPELAQKYLHRESVRSWLMLGGGAVVVGSLIASAAIAAAAPDPATCANSSDFYCGSNVQDEDNRHANVALAVGGAGTLVGLVMACWGLVMNPMPVSEGEASALGDQYNRQLWHRLGLGMRDNATPLGSTPLALSLEPQVTPGSQGLLLKLSF